MEYVFVIFWLLNTHDGQMLPKFNTLVLKMIMLVVKIINLIVVK